MAKIVVLGPGGWGTALAVLFCNNGHAVTVWGKFPEEIQKLAQTRTNPLLPNVTIPDAVELTTDIACAKDCEIAIIATPSFAVRETAHRLQGILKQDTVVVSVAKGFEKETLKTFSSVIAEELPENNIVALSGPSHAEEVAVGVPTSIVAAGKDMAAAEYVQKTLTCDSFRIYTNADVIGVETGAALKNIIAMAAGICDGLGLGDNTIAALVTRGMNEISRLGVKLGAKQKTFAGLSGIGDLIVTCTSRHSRNRRFGKALGEGMSVEAALEAVGMTVESYYATASAKKLAEQYGVEMPIVNECYRILYENGNPRDAIHRLMNRKMKHE